MVSCNSSSNKYSIKDHGVKNTGLGLEIKVKGMVKVLALYVADSSLIPSQHHIGCQSAARAEPGGSTKHPLPGMAFQQTTPSPKFWVCE